MYFLSSEEEEQQSQMKMLVGLFPENLRDFDDFRTKIFFILFRILLEPR